MNTDTQQTNIKNLLMKLSKIGESRYDKDSRTDELNYEAVGLAISTFTSKGLDFAKVAYATFENWNYHDVCAVLAFIFPELDGAGEQAADEWLSNLQRIERILNERGDLKVFTTWNSEQERYNVETYRRSQ